MRSTARDTPELDDLLCFSHLRWSWVYQRPQHLLTRAARTRRVYYFEEPVYGASEPRLEARTVADNLIVLQPQLPERMTERHIDIAQRTLLDAYIAKHNVTVGTLWYYTPMALPFTRHLTATVRVYDCMDELTAFAGAPPALQLLERHLLHHCNIVFTAGGSVHEANTLLHANCHAMPSSVDAHHFANARLAIPEPPPQAALPHPRIGYCGVLDERLDLELIAAAADARPDWQLVFICPVTRIDASSLPQRANIHYLGALTSDALPSDMVGWDMSWMPFVINELTHFISPTTTPEYLAAAHQPVATLGREEARTLNVDQMVHLVCDRDECVTAIATCLAHTDERWRALVDSALAQLSWDITWGRMEEIMSRSAVVDA